MTMLQTTVSKRLTRRTVGGTSWRCGSRVFSHLCPEDASFRALGAVLRLVWNCAALVSDHGHRASSTARRGHGPTGLLPCSTRGVLASPACAAINSAYITHIGPMATEGMQAGQRRPCGAMPRVQPSHREAMHKTFTIMLLI